jgi:hypothetical protein
MGSSGSQAILISFERGAFPANSDALRRVVSLMVVNGLPGEKGLVPGHDHVREGDQALQHVVGDDGADRSRKNSPPSCS